MNSSPPKAPSARAHWYVLLVLLAAVTGFAVSARSDGLFACQVPSSIDEQYIGICNVAKYGDYDHGAFWFDIEKEAVDAASRASVLFLGNSRMQFALSTGELRSWFEAQAISFYLLGFSHHENLLFVGPLLEKMQPDAQMYVINVDNFFDNEMTGPANTVINESDASNRYRQKRRWQSIHRLVCGSMGNLCGHGMSFIRTRSTGEWDFKGADFLAATDFSDEPVTVDETVDTVLVNDVTSRARPFIDALNVDEACVVLTNVPNFDTSNGTARAIAEQLGLPYVAPTMSGLETFDGSHLDEPSASRWAEAFVDELAPYVDRCDPQGNAG